VPRQQVDAAEASERSARARLDSARMSARAAHAQVEAALAQVRAGKAQIAAAQANLTNADLQGSYTHVVAPITGRVSKRSVDLGNVIANGQALMALVSDDLWVTANYKETQLTRMKPGQEAEIVVDAYPDLKFRGHVDSIQRATGSYFSALPAENATGNYVKVVQRVPVKIVFDDDRIRQHVIGPGMSVTPDVKLP
jgi:membrane fusion protein (multidrug efflux system)